MEINSRFFEEIGFSKTNHSFYHYTQGCLEFMVAYDSTVGYTMQCIKKDGRIVKFAKLGRHPYKEMVENIIDRVASSVCG